MEILSNFGFDLKLFFAQIINFLILAYIFKRFLYKPIFNTLKKRREAIKKGLDDAEAAKLALGKAESERDAIIKEANSDTRQLFEDAKKAGEDARQSMLKEAGKETRKLVEDAKNQIIEERKVFEKEATGLVLGLSKSIIEKTLRDLFSKKDQEELVKRAIKKLNEEEK